MENKYPQSIIKAIHEVKSKVEYVEKDGNNSFHKYKYASEAALIEALRPEMQAAGLVIIPSGENCSPIDSNGVTLVTLSYTLCHINGSVWPHKLLAYGQGADRSSKGTVGDKGVYKAITGGGKYFLRTLFQIETGNDPEKVTKTKKGKATKAPADPGTQAEDVENTGMTINSKGQAGRKITEKQRGRLFGKAKEYKWPDTAIKSLIAKYGYESSKDIEHWVDYPQIIKEIENGPGKAA